MEVKITQFSAAADEIFQGNPQLERICTGYSFSEGPVWDIRDDCLYFTDFPALRIYRWTQAGGAELYREKSNRAIGLTMNARGRLIAAESGARRIAYTGGNGSEAIAAEYRGASLNSPNDVVASTGGDILFTDPYSTAMGLPRELDYNGVFRVTPSGECRLLCGDMKRPNGIAFSPGESILYVNDTDCQHILSFPVNEDGSLGPSSVFVTLDTAYGPGAPDGMKVDVHGNVYVTGPGGVWVIDPDGAPAAILHCPEFVGNLCFGGSDSKTLYLTASSSVYSIHVGIPGIVPNRIDI